MIVLGRRRKKPRNGTSHGAVEWFEMKDDGLRQKDRVYLRPDEHENPFFSCATRRERHLRT